MTALDQLNAVLAELEQQSPPRKDDAPAAATAGAPGTQTKTDASNDSPKPAAQTPTLLLPRIEGIPAELRKLKRWAPWRAQWNAKRSKWDKIPCTPSGTGLSTEDPGRWFTFDAAAKAYTARPDHFAGIGLVMTGIEGLVGIDLDGCVSDEGALAPWAEEVVVQASSYTELSPSGHGLRIFTAGDVARDWTNHGQGIEVYAGHAARFLTVTGEALPGRAQVRPAPTGWLGELEQRFAKPAAEKPADADMPELLDEMALPDLAELGLHHKTANFLAEGVQDGSDRSRALFAASVDLASAGLDPAQVLSVLAHNPHAMEVAESHWQSRPLEYLWKHHAQKACARATSKVATAEDFADVSGSAVQQDAQATRPAARFNIVHASEFGKGRKPLSWLIKKILPHATVGVLYGPSGAGKSFLVMDMAVAIARGLPEWRGNRCKQADVLYICAEGAEGAEERLQAHAEFHGYDRAAVPLWMLDDAPNLLLVKDANDLADSIKARCSEGTRLVIVDTLAQVTPGANENTSEQMGLALTHCKLIARKTGAMVLLVAHSGKDQSKGIRGWSGIKGALDVEIAVDRDDDDRHYRVSKMRNGAETEWTPFGLHTVQMGVDEDGDPIASAVVQAVDASPQSKRLRAPSGKNQRTVYRVALDLTELAGPCTAAELVGAAAAALPPPEAGKRDKRVYTAQTAIDDLIETGHLILNGTKLEAV